MMAFNRRAAADLEPVAAAMGGSAMRICFVLLTLMFVVALAAIPALAQNDLYDNGPINGDYDAWTINEGFVVSDSFTLTAGTNQVNGLSFGAWLAQPGDVLESAEVSITSSEFGGTTYFAQTVSFIQSNCMTGSFGLPVCTETGSFSALQLGAGTYWLNLQNAVVNTGDPVYWDENSGQGCTSPGCPSQASESSVGSIPSESFTMLGSSGSSGSTPEPGSLLLFASGVAGVVAWLRRGWRVGL
jgi:PEP-CTERM motif